MAQLYTLPLSTDQRRHLHAIFNTWLMQASDDDYAQFLAIRNEFAPKQVCSFIRLIQGCSIRSDLAQRLPDNLRQLLQASRWLQPGAVGTAAA